MMLFQFDNTSFASLFVRIVTSGEKYGRNDMFTNHDIGSLVEFYDARFPDVTFDHSAPGQFISRYHMSTLLERNNRDQSLDLDSSIMAWTASAVTMRALNVILSAMFVYVPGVSFP